MVMTINVELDERQLKTAVKHFGEPRMDAFVADMQGTTKAFLDKWADEEEEKEPNPIVIITPMGVFEFED